jgi:hypothetical protein
VKKIGCTPESSGRERFFSPEIAAVQFDFCSRNETQAALARFESRFEENGRFFHA